MATVKSLEAAFRRLLDVVGVNAAHVEEVTSILEGNSAEEVAPEEDTKE